MSITLTDLRAQARQVAQDGPTGGTGLQLLLTDPGDYNLAILQALRVFDNDRPNKRVYDKTVTVAGFRFIVGGAGTILPASPSLDAWVDGASYLNDVTHPYLVTSQGLDPLDRNDWRVVDDPGSLTVLEFLQVQPAVGDKIRLAYVNPHVVGTLVADTTIRAGDQQAAIILVASFILQLAAVKSVQNTGNTGLPNDVVDRRTQSDQFRSRAKELREQYGAMVGKGQPGDLQPASGVKDLDVPAGTSRGFLWHSTHGH